MSMVDAVVRRALDSDVEALVALRAEMFLAMRAGNATTTVWQDKAHQWFSERVHNPAFGMFVVERNTQVVACAMGAIRDAAPSPAVPEGRDVLISNVCTLPTYRGHGHGQRAFTAVLDWARASGIRRAELMATTDGQSMYEAAGFTTTKFPAMRALI